MNARTISFAATALLAITNAACSGSGSASETDPSVQPGDESEASALATNDLGDVAAVRVDIGGANRALIGAPSKVAKVLKAFRKSGPTPLCNMAQRPTHFTFYDVKGDNIGTGSVMCFRGTIELKNGKKIDFVSRPGDLNVLQDPTVVADALWGVTKVHARSHAINVDFTRKSELDKVLDAMAIDQKLGPLGPTYRCMPSHALDFYRGSVVVAQATYNCGEDAPATLAVNITFNDPADAAADDIASGGITIRAKDIEDLIDSTDSEG